MVRQLALFFVLIFAVRNAAAQSAVSLPPDPSTLVPVTDSIARSTPMPHSPADILELASAMNGLDVPSTKPWHVKLTWDEFDEDGDNVHSGTLEEFYVNPRKYRRTYTGDTLNQTDVATESGLYRDGDQRWPGPVELQVRSEVLQPLSLALRDQRNIRLDKIDWRVGASKLPCVVLRRTDMTVSDNGLQKFCFDPGTVLLRYIKGRGWDETTCNNFVLFQDRYVPVDVEVTQAGKAFLKIHVEEVEPIAQAADSLFNPPTGSKGPIAGRISLPSATFGDYVLSRAISAFPRGVHGRVTVNIVVGKDGRVIQAEAVDGPAELRAAAVEAIRKYQFRPFLVLDQPVEVESSFFFEIH